MIEVGCGALSRRLVEGTLLAAAAAALSTLGCASQREGQAAFAHLAPARAQPASAGDAGGATAPTVGTTVVATVEGEPVSLRTLAPSLLEAAGGEVLQEHALDQALRAELARLGLRVGKEAVQRERALLLEQLATALERPADASSAAEEALAQLRQRRGLGPRRFAALLWRTAALRALTRQLDPVTLSPEAIEQAYDLAYGERRVARVITLPTLAQAQQVLEALAQGADFATLAATRSTDASAERGGLLEPIARQDPAYPPAIRQALFALAPGRWSSPIAVDQGFAVLLLERIEPAKDAPLEEVREQLVRSLTLQQERLRMDDLAQQLLQRARPVAVDEHLRWSLGALRAHTAPGAEEPR